MTASKLHPGHAILAALFLAAAVLGWRALSVALAPLPAPPSFAPPALADRGLLSRVDPFFPAATRSDENLPVTSLPFSLHGVRADTATGRGSAIIATADGLQQVYGVGDTLADGVTLAAIAADHVVLERGAAREALWLDSAGAQPVQRFDPGAAGTAPPPPFEGGGAGGSTGIVTPASAAAPDPTVEPAGPRGADEPDAIDQMPPPGVGTRSSRADDGGQE